MSRQRKARKEAPGRSTSAVPLVVTRLEKWIVARPLQLFVILVLLASLRIAGTYTVYNHTGDEPAHLGCGMEWLDRGTYTLEAQHPPLARIMSALVPYLAGIRSQGEPHLMGEGMAILYNGGDYDVTLALSRLGILPFFWVACGVVWLWTRRSFGTLEAVAAVFLFSLLPPVLAHAGLSTTDMALTAFLGAAFLAGWAWIEQPTLSRAALFGAMSALAVLSKFSALMFLPVCAAAALLWYAAAARPAPRRVAGALCRRLLPLGAAVLVACQILWAGYRFSFAHSDYAGFIVPAPELFDGIGEVVRHNEAGHRSYLLGEISKHGFYYYYPVVLAVKTPLAFLALAVFGVVLCLRKSRDSARFVPLAFMAGILAVGLYSRINIGVRHVLPIYVAMAVAAAVAGVRLLELARSRWWAGGLLAAAAAWLVLTSALSHPDYLPYTNALAGSEPERILADSDLDWGQDMKRLGRRLQEAGAREVTIVPFFQFPFGRHGFPPIRERYSPLEPSPGWNAVSLSAWKVSRMGLFDNLPDARLWPDVVKNKPERIGGSMLLWYFPAAPAPSAPAR